MKKRVIDLPSRFDCKGPIGKYPMREGEYVIEYMDEAHRKWAVWFAGNIAISPFNSYPAALDGLRGEFSQVTPIE